MIKKCLTILVILAMIGMIAPISATDAEASLIPNDFGIYKSKSVMYVGWNYDYGPGMQGQSMGYTDVNRSNFSSSTHNEFSANTHFNVTAKTGKNVTINPNILYGINHTYINLDTWNYSSTDTVPSEAVTAVTNFNGDLLIVDMFFSPIMNDRHSSFVNATIASGADNKVSIFSEDWNTGESSAPDGFQVRDTLAESLNTTNVPFTMMFFHGLQQTGASAVSANWGQYEDIIAYVAPYI